MLFQCEENTPCHKQSEKKYINSYIGRPEYVCTVVYIFWVIIYFSQVMLQVFNLGIRVSKDTSVMPCQVFKLKRAWKKNLIGLICDHIASKLKKRMLIPLTPRLDLSHAFSGQLLKYQICYLKAWRKKSSYLFDLIALHK